MAIKVIHLVESLDRGAVENWLVRMFEHGQRKGLDLDWTFYCLLGREGSLEARVRALGAKIVRSSISLSRNIAFAHALREELQRGKYEVLHCHHDLVSGLYLAASVGLPIRKRIIHVHNADEGIPTRSVWKRRLYRPLLRHVGFVMADEIVGISNHTLDTFLGGRARDPRCHVIHNYGVDPSCFITPEPDKKLFRREIGVPENALILLFGGRVVPEKNPAFVIDVLSELRKLDGRAVAVFAGAGSLENAVRERAKALGVHEHIRMLGWRRDLPNIMRCAEWFILPRPEQPMEGFGLAVVEAQLAGLRILVSRGVPEDPFLPTASFQRLSLSDSPSKWAQAAIKQLLLSKPSAAAALIALGNSPMDMDAALRHLLSLYE